MLATAGLLGARSITNQGLLGAEVPGGFFGGTGVLESTRPMMLPMIRATIATATSTAAAGIQIHCQSGSLLAGAVVAGIV